ncbi:MAG: radical SAM protein, partial [Deltaproteobacteria bacterium]|nr:radical SAM protein [Deltaproteobacteria bacterium]
MSYLTIVRRSFSAGKREETDSQEKQGASPASPPPLFPENSGGEGELRLPFPWPLTRAAYPVLPVFLPFAGCPARCVFCAQDKLTGVAAAKTERDGAARALDALSAALEGRAAAGAGPVEVGFFGGTFSAQPEDVQEACFARLRPWRERGLVAAARCSTRPDALSAGRLARLKALGLDAVELGVQSFSSRALAETRRGYTGEQAVAACSLVRESGLALGVQLMPGMPGADAAVFQADAATALAAGAAFLRAYPCLVLEGTELARAWRAGAYAPWSLALTVRELARALLAAGKAAIPIIRMGLPLDGNFAPHILAGPAHPALGALVQAEALHSYISEHAAGGSVAALRLPRNCRGFFWGEKGKMRARWAALGLHGKNVVWEG